MAESHRDARGLAALPGDVPDQDPAAVIGRQDVIEIAADLDPLSGGFEDDRYLQAGDFGRARRP